MKITLSFIFVVSTLFSFAQQQTAPADTIPRDTVAIDLQASGSFDRLQQLQGERQKLENEYKLLEEKFKGLNSTSEEVLLGDMRREPRLKGRAPVRYYLSGTVLFVLVEKRATKTGKK